MAKKNLSMYLLVFALFAGALGYLCIAGFSENSVYFLNVSEAKALKPDQLAQARLFGLVSGEGIKKDGDPLHFQLLDKDDLAQVIPVVYSGVVPDTFKPGAEVIVEGGMESNGSFIAKTLMTKCPSKYQKENRQASPRRI